MLLNPKKAYTWFDANFGLKRSTQGWFIFDCPNCGGKRKMAVHFKYGVVKCWKCEHKKRVLEFIAEVEDISTYHARVMLQSVKEAKTFISVDDGLRRVSGVVSLPKG